MLISEKSAIVRSQNTSLTVSKTKEEAVRLMKAYNPSEGVRFSQYPERCVMGKAPTLAEVRRDYGASIVRKWMVIQINDYSDFAIVNEDRKPDLVLVQQLADMIVARYYWLKMSEVMLFFTRMKYGDYGETYGSIDATRILWMLKAFLDERARIIDRCEQERRERQAAEDRKRAISREEYERLKALKKKEQET